MIFVDLCLILACNTEKNFLQNERVEFLKFDAIKKSSFIQSVYKLN